MSSPIAVFLGDFPEHSELIGHILLGFSEIEGLLIDVVGSALRDHDTAVRILYRLRGAQSRLDVADAILRPFYAKLGLSGVYAQLLGAVRHCRKIRNQYAHCSWYSNGGRLYFLDLEESANTAEGVTTVSLAPIDIGLLRKQHAFFKYTVDVAFYLDQETNFRLDRRRRHKQELPKSLAVPSLHSPRR